MNKLDLEKAFFTLTPRRCGFCGKLARTKLDYDYLFDHDVCAGCDKIIDNYNSVGNPASGPVSVKEYEEINL